MIDVSPPEVLMEKMMLIVLGRHHRLEGHCHQCRRPALQGGQQCVLRQGIHCCVANRIAGVEDLEKYRPGLKKQFYDWFTVSPALPPSPAFSDRESQYYKVVKGDGLNTIVGKDYKDATYMREAIAESHGFWQDLILGKEKHDKISTRQTSNPRACKSYIPSKNATREFNIPEKSNVLPPAAKPKQYDYWYYLDKDFNVIPGQVIDVQ